MPSGTAGVRLIAQLADSPWVHAGLGAHAVVAGPTAHAELPASALAVAANDEVDEMQTLSA